MKCYLDVAGLSVLVQTPWTLVISDRFRPFVKSAVNGTVDSTVTVHMENTLSAPSPDAMWHGPLCYDVYEGARCVWFADGDRAVCARTLLLENGDADVAVTTAYAHAVRDLSGIFNLLGFENWLLQHGGLLLHASLINDQGRGIAFAGESGVGKSTQADWWHRVMGATVVNGDRAVLRKTDDGWYAFGSPFAGTSGIYNPDGVKLTAIVLLEQAQTNTLRTVEQGEAARKLYPELSIHRFDARFVEKAVDLTVDLVKTVSIRQLSCLPDETAVWVLKEGLS